MNKVGRVIIGLLTVGCCLLSGCEKRANQKVQWSKWFDNGDGLTHTRHNLNDITQEETENHEWELKSYIVEPTEVTPGEALYTCDKCGAKDQRKVPPTGNYVFDQKVVDEKYLCERYSDHSASYYMSSVEGAYGNPDCVFEVSDLPDDYTEVDYIQSDGRQWVNTGVKNDGTKKVSVNGVGLSARLPEEYQEVEYIESTNKQFIDTDIILSSKDKVTVDFLVLDLNRNSTIWCARKDMTEESMTLFCLKGTLRYDYYNIHKELNNVDVSQKTHIEAEAEKLYVNGQLRIQHNEREFNSGGPLKLFASYDGEGKISSNIANRGSVRLFSFSIQSKEGVTKHNFVPCYRKTDGKTGVFDLTTKYFYEKSNAGDEFVLGAEVISSESSRLPSGYREIEYIEGAGSQYINSMYIPGDNFSYEADIYIGENTNDCPLMNIYTGTQSFGLYVYQNKWYRGIVGQSFGSVSKNTRYKIRDSYQSGSQKLYVDDELVVETNAEYENLDTEYPFYIMGYDRIGVYTRYDNYLYKLYSLKFYEADSLVRDYVPCLRETDYKPGLFDLVENKFYVSATEEEFIIPSRFNILTDDDCKFNFVKDSATGIYSNKETDSRSYLTLQIQGWTGANLSGTHYEPVSESYENLTTPFTRSYVFSLNPDTSYLRIKHNGETSDLDLAHLQNINVDIKYRFTFTVLSSDPLQIGGIQLTNLQLIPITNDSTSSDTGRLPSGYVELDYIEATGTQYIDADVAPGTNLVFDARLSFGETDSQHTRILCQGNYGLRIFENHFTNFVESCRYVVSSISIQNDEIYSVQGSNTSLLVNGESGEEQADNDTPEGNVKIFENTVGKLYGCKLWDGSTLVRDFVPSYRTSDNEIGLFDLANNIFYVNGGTGTFKKGNEVSSSSSRLPIEYQELTYVKSTGHQWIDAKVSYNPTDTASHIIDFQYLDDTMIWSGSNWYLQYSFSPRYVHNHERVILEQQYNNQNYKSYINGTLVNEENFKTVPGPNGKTGIFRMGNTNDHWYDEDVSHKIVASSQIFYSQKIFKNGQLVRDFIPCYEKSTNETGLFDLVSSSFFKNDGDEPLLRGEEVNIQQSYRDEYVPRRNDIPDYYYQLNYIESTGTQEIDTGIIGNAKFDFKARFIINGRSQVMGYEEELGKCFGIESDGKYVGTELTSGEIDQVSVDFGNTTSGIGKITVDGNSSPDLPILDVSESSLKLFSAGGSNKCSMLFYEGKIYQGTELKRDFVPVMQKYTGISGLFDVVEGRFYTSNTNYEILGGGIVSDKLDASNLNIFCNPASDKSHPNKTRISTYQIYNKNVLSNNFIACIRNSDGVAGFYDIKTNKFITTDSQFPLTYGSIIGHKLDEGKIVKAPTHDTEGEMVYKCVYTNQEIHLKTERTAYKVTFVPENNQFAGVKIFNTNNPSDYFTSLVGYSRNINTFNYSKSKAFIEFELPDDGHAYEIITFGGTINKVNERHYQILEISADMYVQLRQVG